MARIKLEIKATSEQIEELYSALKAGAQIQLALQKAGITMATYLSWVAVASVAIEHKERKELEQLEAASGISAADLRDMAERETRTKRTGIGYFIKPSEASMLLYQNSRKFRKFADECLEIVNNCNSYRSEFATAQLAKIALSTNKAKGINPSGAMWWLERNMPDIYAKPSDKALEQGENNVAPIEGIQVEFVDPNTPDQQQRLIDIENEILNVDKEGGKA